MKEKLISTHIDSDGEVIAMTRIACYKFKQKLKDPEKLVKRLAEAQEIDPELWEVEWEYSSPVELKKGK